jgi:pimeloyl-ACP methyl ester carboxylesterase
MERGMNYKEVRITTNDGIKLYGWFIIKDNKNPTIIYFHENAGNIGMRLPYCEFLYKSLNSNLLLVGYRGYGYSEGTPSEKGIMIDSEAIVDYVLYNDKSEISQYIDKDNVYILGRSLGGAVAVHIIHKLNPRIKGLILENTFSSMGDMVDHLFPMITHLKSFLLKNNWPTKAKIDQISLPMMFISSSNDELVPSHHMEMLYSLATKAAFKQKYIVIGGTHNESWQINPKKYLSEFELFFRKCDTIENVDKIIEEEPVDDNTSINKEEETYLIYKN